MADVAPFDAQEFKNTTKETWRRTGAAWNRWAPTLQRWLGPATGRMLDMARLAPGYRVLDIAAGAGNQTLLAAARVGPSGSVLATDLTPEILEFAALNAREAGFTHVRTQVMDGESLNVEPGSFDAVICRLGLMFFTDPVKGFQGIRQALKPGTWLGGVVFSTPEKNKGVAIPSAIARRYANQPAPAPDQPGMFRLSPDGVGRQLLALAGFQEIEEQIVSSPLVMESTAEYMRFATESFGGLRTTLSGLPQSEQDAAWKEIAEAMRQFEGPSGFVGPCEHRVFGARA